MIPLACVALYVVIGWRVAVRAYLRIEAHDRQWRRDLCAKYPGSSRSQAAIDQEEEQFVCEMAGINRMCALLAGVLWPGLVIGLTLKHFFDVSIAREREKADR
jgi:hypothetical protein